MENKNYRCTNRDCEAYLGEIVIPFNEIEQNEGKCPFCSKKDFLEEVEEETVKVINKKKVYIIAAGSIIIIALLSFFFFRNISDKTSGTGTGLEPKKDSIQVDTIIKPSIEPKPDTIKILEAQLFSIGNSKQQMEDRIAAIEPTLKEFFSSTETPKVKVMGKQGTVVEIKDAESYLKWLAGIVTLKGLKVHDVEYDSLGKVRLLEVEEIHETN